VELIISTHEGAHPIACSTSLLQTPDGYIVGVVAALGDLSTVKALEVERGRAERLNYFETLAAALAHEIGNPIAPIKLMTQLLPARFHSEVFIHDFTRTVSREISRIEKLVERLRSLSRPAHRERVAVDLRTALRDAIDLAQPVLDEKRINLVTRISARALVICGDPSELQELFLNLLTNAAEATPDAGEIVVEATCESSDALVRVSDSGLGIASDIVDRIFEPFVSSKHRGSGLGLTICSGVIERHRGSIAACNTGTGAMFTVRIPLAPAATTTSEESPS
jgi:signal transduction histidine kinase